MLTPSLKLAASHVLLLAALAASLLLACQDTGFQVDKRRTIYVVGDGVPPIRKDINRLFPLNRAQGQAMWRGAKAALTLSPRLESIRPLVILKGFDDASLAMEAESFAKSLRAHREVIAVIGHATSQTTRAAIGYYSKAGIPVLMPIATSDLVMYPEDRLNLRVGNAFRLPPSDARAQAPAVAFLVKNKRLGKILLVQDISEGAKGYSSTLIKALSPLVRSAIATTVQVDRAQKQSFTDAADTGQSNDVSAIVFCGYGSTAQDLFYALREKYKDKQLADRPVVILTDGCLVDDLRPEGFVSFLTFPHLGIEETKDLDQDPDVKIVKSLYSNKSPLSYEPFGYDAMLILGQAMQACLDINRLSRDCIIAKLIKPPQPFFGVTGVYEFEAGENRHSRYDVFRSGPDTGYRFDTSSKETISAEELSRIRSGS